MMRVLKYILVLMICLMTTSFMPKTEAVTSIYKFQQDKGQIYLNWQPSGSGYWTKHTNYHVYNDFSFMVARSTYTYDGYYYFSVWLYSQSYYWDGYNANYTSTNIRYVNIYSDGYLVTQDNTTIGITFYDKLSPRELRFKSKNKFPKFYITWKQMSAK
jgi:hypothetical protein